jgi:FMN phosphatase YigB (HAD superfamily)
LEAKGYISDETKTLTNVSPMSIILLDIGNVLVTVDFMRFCRAIAIDPSAGADEIFRKYCIGELKEKFETGWIAPLDYLAIIARDSLVKAIPFDEIKLHWQDIFAPLDGAVDAVKLLQERYSLWIMSDTDPLHFTFLLNHYPLLRSADRYYLSFEHGQMKTGVAAFAHVLESSGSSTDEFILIDDKAVNCASALQAGIRSIEFRNWQDALALL